MNPVVGVLVSITSDDTGPIGTIVVKGVRIKAVLSCVADASIGDTLLIDAGVAVAVLDRASNHASEGMANHVPGDTR